MLHNYRIPRPGCLRSYADMLIQLARCKFFYSRPPSHGYECDFILVRSGPFQKTGRREVAFTQGYRNKPSEPVQNRFKIRMVRKSEPEIRPFANLPFHSHMNKKTGPVQVHFPDLLGFYGYTQVHFKSGRFAILPFHSHMNKKGRSTFRTCWVSTATRKCISLTLSQYIRETLCSFRSAYFFYFRHKLLNFNFSEPPTLFLTVFLKISLIINFLPFGDGQ